MYFMYFKRFILESRDSQRDPQHKDGQKTQDYPLGLHANIEASEAFLDHPV